MKEEPQDIKNQKVASWLLGACLLIIILMPFHGFISTWLGSNFGYLLLFKAWKELLLVSIVAACVYLLSSDKSLRRCLYSKDKKNLIILIGIFITWQIMSAIVGGQNAKAVALGLAIQVRWGLFFICCLIAVYYSRLSQSNIQKLVLIPVSIVVGFGLLQMFILPHDFLTHFGYQKNITIPPFFTIDEQLDQIRIASTLRGPNPLGVYLILPITFLISHFSFLIRKKSRSNNIPYFIFLISTLVVLYGSHSRGAWLGMIMAVGVMLVLWLPARFRILLISVGLGLVLLASAGIYQYKNTDFVQDVVLHDNPEEGGEVSSNEGHVDSMKSGIKNVVSRPLIGCGVGCAGPASFHNKNGAKISENYFIQTAEESGLVGSMLLFAIFVMVGYILLQQSKNNSMLVPLLASFIGVSVASLTAHAWADDTIVYVWWGIAGFVMYNKTNNEQKNDKNKEKIKESIKKTITSKS